MDASKPRPTVELATQRLFTRRALRQHYYRWMACRISELVVDARDPDLLARFWCEVLGYIELERDEGGIEIGPPGVGFGGAQPTIVFIPTDKPKADKLPLHIDVNATDRNQEEELHVCSQPALAKPILVRLATESWHVLADPEGNEFCLLKQQLPAV